MNEVNWKYLKLKEVAKFHTCKTSIDNITVCNYVSTENMISNFGGVKIATSIPNLKKVNEFNKGDILLSNIRPYFKKVYYARDFGGCSNDVLNIRGDEKLINKKFLYYSLANNTFIDYVMSGVKGTKMPRGDKDHIMYYSFQLPNLEEQQSISELLSSLDHKIENNHKINVVLEELAQSIFKMWFVDFDFPNEDGKPYKSSGGEMVDSTIGTIPKGWDVTSIDDVTSKVATGLNPRRNFVLGEGNNYYVTIKNMSNNNVVLDSKCDKITNDAIDKINKRSELKKGDLLISGIGTIGRVHLIFEEPKNWNISESVFTLRANEMVSEFFLYVLLLNKKFQEYSIANAIGSVQKGLRMKDLKDYTFALPPKDKMCEIEEVFRSLISQVKENDIENRKLSKLRDTLLPKLMSGEIRVPIDKD